MVPESFSIQLWCGCNYGPKSVIEVIPYTLTSNTMVPNSCQVHLWPGCNYPGPPSTLCHSLEGPVNTGLHINPLKAPLTGARYFTEHSRWLPGGGAPGPHVGQGDPGQHCPGAHGGAVPRRRKGRPVKKGAYRVPLKGIQIHWGCF